MNLPKPIELTPHQRIKKLNDHIKIIKETVYPDNYYEVLVDTMVEALEDRIEMIKNGMV